MIIARHTTSNVLLFFRSCTFFNGDISRSIILVVSVNESPCLTLFPRLSLSSLSRSMYLPEFSRILRVYTPVAREFIVPGVHGFTDSPRFQCKFPGGHCLLVYLGCPSFAFHSGVSVSLNHLVSRSHSIPGRPGLVQYLGCPSLLHHHISISVSH